MKAYHQYLDAADGTLYVTITGFHAYGALLSSVAQYARVVTTAENCLVDSRDASFRLTDLQIEDLAQRVNLRCSVRCAVLVSYGTMSGLWSHYVSLVAINPELIYLTTSLTAARQWVGLSV